MQRGACHETSDRYGGALASLAEKTAGIFYGWRFTNRVFADRRSGTASRPLALRLATSAPCIDRRLRACDKRRGKHFSKRFLYPSVPWPMRHFLTLKI
jgi:hypothetical protein